MRIPNGEVIGLLHPPGRLMICFNTVPNGSWSNFATFSQGPPIAILEVGTTQDISTGSVQIGRA
jgi:hypothetical protein